MQRILLRSAARRQLHLARAKRAVGISRRHSTICTSRAISSRTVPLSHDRIKTRQLRCFSTTVEDDHEMERFTVRIVNHKTTPLGTMSAALVDDTIAACQHWCSTGSGYGIDSADRLLQRLVCEYASGASAARQRMSAIADLQLQVLHSWLTLSTFRFALVKAESLLVNIVQWHQRGISPHDPFPEMVTVVEACLLYPDLAANLLLQWTQTPNSDTATELIPLMNATLESSVQMNDAMTAALLLQRMETLETEYGWKNLDLSSDARKLVMEGPMSISNEEGEELVIEQDEPSEDTGVKHLSDFELQAMQGRFVEFLQTASREDKKRVLEMAKQLNTLPQTDATASLFKAFMDYFVKIEDAKHATQLLSRMDVDSDADGQSPVNENLFLDVLRLWASSREVDSPWRAQEIVKRMEELERLGRLEVSTSTYNLLCEAWAGSADPSASRRVEAIFSRMLDARKNGDKSKTPNLDSFKLYLSVWPKPAENHVKQVVSELMDQGAELGTEQSCKLVEKSLEALSIDAPNATARQLQDRGNIVSKLFRQAVSQGISVTPTMCINLIKTQQFEARVRELSYLETLTGVDIPLECYSLTIMALLDARKPSFNQKKNLVAHTFHRYAEGKLSAKSSEMQALMICVMEELLRQGRPSPIDEMLRLFEDLMLSDEAPVKNVEIPVECFNSTMTAWFFDHKTEKAEETYNRLISYYEAGHSSLEPNADSVATMLKIVLSSTAPEMQVAFKATKLFEDLLKRYDATGNNSFKPNYTCFAHVLMALTRVSSPKAAKMAEDYLMKMISMGLIPTTSFFNKVMFAIGRAGAKHSFLRTEALLKQMEKVGVEPDHLTYKNIIRACSSPEPQINNRRRILSALMDAAGKLRKIGVDAGSYGMLAMALQTQLTGESDENRDKIAYTTCRLCYEDGFLNKQNAELFRRILSKKAWLKLTEKFNEIKGKSQATDQPEDERMVVH